MTVQTVAATPHDPLAAGAAPATAGAAAPGPAARAGAGHEGGSRDTVESILIAFILAFVFRAFVVEAFVIPTGSMAPTLLGAHARFTCDDCGYQFETNFSSGGQADDQSIPSQVGHGKFPHTECPNCGYAVHDPDDLTDSSPVPIHYGDRILVLKYAYLLNDPRRWDVVVFKSPDEPSAGAGPYTTNFIKRLVGKPNETLMILDGDVYVSPAGGGTAPADFKVQAKPRHVQDALWRVVYDNDFVPRPAGPDDDPRQGWEQPWQAVAGGAGWDLGTAGSPRRVFRFDGPQATGTIRFDPDANRGRAFTDWLAYAQRESGRHNVSDARLRLVYERTAGDGPLRLALTKHDDTFTAEVSPTGVTLFRRTGQSGGGGDLGAEVASAGPVGGLAGGPVAIDFANVDYAVTLRVAGTEVLRLDYEPDVAALIAAHTDGRPMPRPEVRITAANQACALSHLSLWRDVYYTNGPESSIRWARPLKPITMGADEYFVLGDNTVISKDARYWTDPIDLPDENLKAQAGVVPGRFLLGKAFFVYWPAGYRPLPGETAPGAIPNFGDMRLIH